MRNRVFIVLLGHFIQTYADPGGFSDFDQLSSRKSTHGSHWDHDWGQPWGQHGWYQGPQTTQRARTRKSTANKKLTTRFHAKTTSDPVTQTEKTTYKPFNLQEEIAISPDDRDQVFTRDVSHVSPNVETVIEQDSASAKVSVNEQVNTSTAVSVNEQDNTSNVVTVKDEGIPLMNTRIETPVSDDSSSHWHVGIYRKTVMPYTQICGGSLIKSDTVISAGYCFWTFRTKQLPADQFAAAAGKAYRAWDDPRDLNPQYSDIKSVVITQVFVPCLGPDLAVVTLVTPFRFIDGVKAVCLEKPEKGLTTGDTRLIAGWAIPSDVCKPSERIIWSFLPFIDPLNCSLEKERFGNDADKMCTDDTKSKTKCATDSGSGLVFYKETTPYLRGVATFIADELLCFTFKAPSFSPVVHEFWPQDNAFELLLRNSSYPLSSLEECRSFYRAGQLQNQTGQLDTDAGVVTSVNLTIIPLEEENIRYGALGTGSTPVPTLGNTSAPAFEWHVGVYTKAFTPFMQICGGTLVKLDFVISAAHCFWDNAAGQQPASQFSVAGGKFYRPWNSTQDKYAQQSDVSEIIIPPRFRGETTSFQDDIAILRLSSTFSLAPGVRPACVDFGEALEREQLASGNKGTVAGWGLTQENGTPSKRLNYLELPYVEINDCFDASDPSFLKYITSDKICAGDQITGKALCRGDSGGGLIVFSGTTPYLRGVASTAQNNNNLCNAFAIATFTQLYAHRTFLRDNIPDVDKCNGTGNGAQSGAIGNGAVSVPFETGNGLIGANTLEITGNNGAQSGTIGNGAVRVPFGTGNGLINGNRQELTANSGAQSGTIGNGAVRVPFGTGNGLINGNRQELTANSGAQSGTIGNGAVRVPFATGNGLISGNRQELTANGGAQSGTIGNGAVRVPFGTGNDPLDGNSQEMTGNNGAQSGTIGNGAGRVPFGTGSVGNNRVVGNGMILKPPEFVTIEGPVAASKTTEAPPVPPHLVPYNNFVCQCHCKN